MESQPPQDHSTEANVKPASRLLRFGLASIATLVLGELILCVTRATGMLVGGDTHYFQMYLGHLVPFALLTGIATAAYPRRGLSSRHNAFIVAVVGAAVGCLYLCYFLVRLRIALSSNYSHGLQDLSLWSFYLLGWNTVPYCGFQMASCWIATGALAMLVTLTRRTRTVLATAAALCVLTVVLPSPIFNLVEHNQDLTVAFVVPDHPGESAARPLRAISANYGSHPPSRAETNAAAAHVLEALRKAGLPGPYRVTEVDQSGTGKKALQIIVLNPPFPAEAQLPQPDGTELIYTSQPDGWHKIPAQGGTVSWNTEIRWPPAGSEQLAMYMIHTAIFSSGFGGAIRPN